MKLISSALPDPAGYARNVRALREADNVFVDDWRELSNPAPQVCTYAPIVANELYTLRRLAERYEGAPNHVDDRETLLGYEMLKRDLKLQFEALGDQYHLSVEFTSTDPYAGYEDMRSDITRFGRLKVYTGNDVPKAHPLSEPFLSAITPVREGITYNHILRATHDFYGHFMADADFSTAGEVTAYRNQAKRLRASAQSAFATETLSQTAWVKHYGTADRPFPYQKSFLTI